LHHAMRTMHACSPSRADQPKIGVPIRRFRPVESGTVRCQNNRQNANQEKTQEDVRFGEQASSFALRRRSGGYPWSSFRTGPARSIVRPCKSTEHGFCTAHDPTPVPARGRVILHEPVAVDQYWTDTSVSPGSDLPHSAVWASGVSLPHRAVSAWGLLLPHSAVLPHKAV
jgi:hypothetical protein